MEEDYTAWPLESLIVAAGRYQQELKRVQTLFNLVSEELLNRHLNLNAETITVGYFVSQLMDGQMVITKKRRSDGKENNYTPVREKNGT